MIPVVVGAVLLAFGFVAGAVYEATRKGGSQEAWAVINGRPKP